MGEAAEYEWTVEEAKEAVEEVVRNGLMRRRLYRYQMDPRVRAVEVNRNDDISDEDEDEAAAAENRTINLDESQDEMNMNMDRHVGLNRLLLAIEVESFTLGDQIYQIMQLIEEANIPLSYLRSITLTQLKYVFTILPKKYTEWQVRCCLFKRDDFAICVEFLDTSEPWLTLPKSIVTSYLVNRKATRKMMLDNLDCTDQCQVMCQKFNEIPYSPCQRLTSIGYEKSLALQIVQENQNHPLFTDFVRRFRLINAPPTAYQFWRKFIDYKRKNGQE